MLYVPSAANGFVNWDDPAYITENPAVQRGLQPDTIVWAFRTGQTGNWHPLTWLSHLADTTLFGPGPAARHLVNAGLHGAVTALLFLLFVAWTGEPWRSAAVAALFAVHPIHVESVTWISERKDLLCAVAGLASLAAWTAGISPGTSKTSARRSAWRGASLALFALGLLAKPMIVTLPFLMLLLDVWPLRRLRWPVRGRELTGRLVEKAPFAVLAAASSIMTLLVQRAAGAMEMGDRLPFAQRAGNAAVSAVAYLRHVVWPSGLSPFYPWQVPVPAPAAAGAAALLIALTGAALWQLRSRPWVTIGWLWFAGMLVPVSGLVQVGLQARADRYLYLPLAGLLVAAVWSVPRAATPKTRAVAVAIGVPVLAVLCLLTIRQQGYWRDGLALWQRAIVLFPDDPTIRTNLAHALEEDGRTDEAVANYERGGRPERAANVLVRAGRRAEAIERLSMAAKSGARAPVLRTLGVLLDEEGRTAEGAARLRQAVAADPADAEARVNLSTACDRLGLAEEALRQAEEAVRLRPDLFEARFNRALLLQKSGRLTEAIADYEALVASGRADASTLHNLGFALQASGRRSEAIARWREALRLDPTRATTARALEAALRASDTPGTPVSGTVPGPSRP